MSEIHAHIGLVVGVFKIVDPCCGVGVDIYNISVEEVEFPGESACDGGLDYLAIVGDISRVFRNHGHVCRDGAVGVVFTATGIQTVFALCGLGVVVHFVAEVHLLVVELAHAGYGVGAVDRLDGALLVLIGVAPGYGLVPVEVGLHGIAFFVFLNLEFLVAAISGVGEAFADYGVAHPEHELLILAVGNLCLVHPEAVDRNASGICGEVPRAVGLVYAHSHRATVDQHHSVRSGLGPRGAANAGHFSTCRASACARSARRHGGRRGK